MYTFTDHTYAALPNIVAKMKLDVQIDETKIAAEKLCKEKIKNRNLRKRKMQLEDRVSSLENLLSEEKDKFNESTYYDLLSLASDIPSAIFSRYGKKMKKMEDRNYSEEMRKFSLTLFSYSRKAYEYVRGNLDDCLPHPDTIKNWLKKIDGSPGLCQQAFNQLKGIVDQKRMLDQKVSSMIPLPYTP